MKENYTPDLQKITVIGPVIRCFVMEHMSQEDIFNLPKLTKSQAEDLVFFTEFVISQKLDYTKTDMQINIQFAKEFLQFLEKQKIAELVAIRDFVKKHHFNLDFREIIIQNNGHSMKVISELTSEQYKKLMFFGNCIIKREFGMRWNRKEIKNNFEEILLTVIEDNIHDITTMCDFIKMGYKSGIKFIDRSRNN